MKPQLCFFLKEPSLFVRTCLIYTLTCTCGASLLNIEEIAVVAPANVKKKNSKPTVRKILNVILISSLYVASARSCYSKGTLRLKNPIDLRLVIVGELFKVNCSSILLQGW